MCDPISIGVAVAAIGAGQAIVQHIGQNQLHKATETAGNLNYAQKQDTLSAQANQLGQEQSAKAEDTAIASLQAEGAIAASAGEMGYAPTSVVSSLNSVMFGIGRQASVDTLNVTNQRNQLARDSEGADIQRQTDLLKAPKSSGVALALGIASSAAKGVQAYGGAGGR